MRCYYEKIVLLGMVGVYASCVCAMGQKDSYGNMSCCSDIVFDMAAEAFVDISAVEECVAPPALDICINADDDCVQDYINDVEKVSVDSLIDAIAQIDAFDRQEVCVAVCKAAAARGDKAVIDALYENYEADMVYIDGSETALMIAAKNGHAECVSSLVEYESTQTDSMGQTALMMDSEAGHTACVEILSPYKSRRQDSNGHTALMFSVRNGDQDCVRLLLSEVDLVDAEGTTAVSLAMNNGDEDVVNMLTQAGQQDEDLQLSDL